MFARSRCARGVILTRYAMRGFEFGEEFLDVAAFATLCLDQALADALAGIGAGGEVEEALIGLGIHDDSGSLAFHREYNGAFALLELLHKVAGPAAESSQRLDILRNIKHRHL